MRLGYRIRLDCGSYRLDCAKNSENANDVIRWRTAVVQTTMGTSRKAITLMVGAVGLAAALTTAALVAPQQAGHAAPAFTPSDPAQVLAHVPARDRAELAAHEALAADPAQLEIAVGLAQADIARARAASDPRYLGQAQAVLAPWWQQAAPPSDVLLLRATIRQSLHEFPAALADLAQLLAQQPRNVQARLTQAVVATVVGNYALAQQACDGLQGLVGELVLATCRGPLDAMKGHSEQARARINAALASTREPTPAIAAWANSTLAEIAVMRGDRADAEQILRAMLRDDANDSYALALLADVLLASGRAADAATLLHGHDIVDNLLVRHAIAAHQAQAPEAFELRAQMQARMAAAAERHDRIHAREEAMYVLAVDGDAPRAATIALENWQVQKELADARLLMACGQAAGDRTAITTVTEWMTAHGIVDATLMAAIGGAK